MIGNDGWESSATDIVGIHDYDAHLEHIRQRYRPEIKADQLFDRRGPGGRIHTLDGFPHRGQPITLTEFGGIAYAKSVEPGDEADGSATTAEGGAGTPVPWGYSTALDQHSFQQKYQALLDTVSHTAMFAGFCYTQFVDTYQEANGLPTADRRPKIPIEEIARATRASRTHIPGDV